MLHKNTYWCLFICNPTFIFRSVLVGSSIIRILQSQIHTVASEQRGWEHTFGYFLVSYFLCLVSIVSRLTWRIPFTSVHTDHVCWSTSVYSTAEKGAPANLQWINTPLHHIIEQPSLLFVTNGGCHRRNKTDRQWIMDATLYKSCINGLES